MQQTFLDIIYKIFYDTSQRDFKDVQLILSEKFNFPSIEFEPQIVVKVPIPRKTTEGTIYCNSYFSDSIEDQTVAWSLFLSTIYHLAAHVAVSQYSIYDTWKKNKTPRIFWKIIDFIEDDAVERYLSVTNPDIWENISRIRMESLKSQQSITKKQQYAKNLGSKSLETVKEEMSNEILQCFDQDHQNHVLQWATYLYKNQNIISEPSPFFYEQHFSNTSLILKQNKIQFTPSGKFQSTINKLSFLYLEEKERIENILHSIRKDVFGLNFDDIVLPNEDIYAYFKLKEKNKKIIKKIREQIRQVVNNAEDPRTNFYGGD